MNDQKIIELLKSEKRNKAFLKLYKNYAQVEKLILSKGGTKEDAKDIFQEAMIIFYEKVTTTDFQLTSTISTYLYSVCRFLWKNQLTKKKGKQSEELSFDLSTEEVADLQQTLDREERFKQLESVVMQIGEKCLALLKLFYYEGLKMSVIAKKVGLKSEKIAKNQKYKCLERAKLKVKAL